VNAQAGQAKMKHFPCLFLSTGRCKSNLPSAWGKKWKSSWRKKKEKRQLSECSGWSGKNETFALFIPINREIQEQFA